MSGAKGAIGLGGASTGFDPIRQFVRRMEPGFAAFVVRIEARKGISMADEITPTTPTHSIPTMPGGTSPKAPGGASSIGADTSVDFESATTTDVDFAPAETLAPATGFADDAGGKRSAKETIKTEAGKLQTQATDRARSFAGDGKAKATGALGDFARMMNDAAGSVDDRLGAQYGDYARSAASYVSGFADTLDRKEVDELVADARDFVRKSPMIAIGTAAAVGFVLARVIKAGIDGVADSAENASPRV